MGPLRRICAPYFGRTGRADGLFPCARAPQPRSSRLAFGLATCWVGEQSHQHERLYAVPTTGDYSSYVPEFYGECGLNSSDVVPSPSLAFLLYN